jgi:hypothetical protein
MKPILLKNVQEVLNNHANKLLYIHLETTNGAYAAHNNQQVMAVSAFIRNGKVQFSQAKITGDNPYRVGLKIEDGWIYAQGLTDWEVDSEGRVLLAGHDSEGKIAISLQLSEQPFL